MNVWKKSLLFSVMIHFFFFFFFAVVCSKKKPRANYSENISIDLIFENSAETKKINTKNDFYSKNTTKERTHQITKEKLTKTNSIEGQNTNTTSFVNTTHVMGKKMPPPPYPYVAQKQGLEGVCTIKISIDTNGKVLNAEIIKSSGHEILDICSQNTVLKKWDFYPQSNNTTITKEFEFQMN